MTQNMLFIAPTRIGDAVLSASILRHISEHYPDSAVTIATSPLAAPLFAGYPQLAGIIPVTKRTYNRHWLSLWTKTFPTRWHSVWDMRNSILTYTLLARHRHSFINPKTNEPKVKQYEAALKIEHLPYPILWPRAEDAEAAAKLLPTTSRYLVFAPIANWAPKEWPLEHFIAAAKKLLNGWAKDYRPVIICAGHEREKALPMLETLREFHPVDLTDGTAHLLTIYAAMQRAHGFIGNDSGLMHMAAASGIPTLGLFGPTPHKVYQPWGERAGYTTASGNDLSQLAVDQVVEAFVKLATP